MPDRCKQSPRPPQQGPAPIAVPPTLFVCAFSLPGISLCSATPWQSPAEVTSAAGYRNVAAPQNQRCQAESPQTHPMAGQEGFGTRWSTGTCPRTFPPFHLLLRLLETQHVPENRL